MRFRVWFMVALLGLSSLHPAKAADDLELVESFPIETDLDNPDLRDAHEVWGEMIAAAQHSLDFAEFYASNETGSRLEDIVRAIESAAERGVRVRFLAEERFYKTYPETLERLDAHRGIEMRRYDLSALGGVHHAKYFIVDGRDAFVGSQNFDWRALTHIQEVGLRVRHAELLQPLLDTFTADWAYARPDSQPATASPTEQQNAYVYAVPVHVTYAGQPALVTPTFSPRGMLPDDQLWDLPRLVELMNRARNTIRVQLLSYGTTGRDATYFDALETALRRAAARGVHVQLLFSDWCKRAGTIEGLKSLQVLPNIDVKLVTIPLWSGGFIPYARVAHAKYLVVDGESCWVGTSNWEKSYFYSSRNVGFIIESAALAGRLDAFFDKTWDSAYATLVDPAKEYEAPRIGE